MCFAVYAPGSILELVYVNEDIRLFRDSSSRISVELFIKNKSNDPIQVLQLLYPNKFIQYWRNDQWYFKDPKYDDLYTDLTSDFTKVDDPCNDHYNKREGSALKCDGQTLRIYEFDENIADLSQVPPRFTGTVRGDVTFLIFGAQAFKDDYFMVRAMQEWRYSHFAIEFSIPIEPEETRCIKLRFKPRCATVGPCKHLRFRGVLNRLRGVELNYKIYGPSDVTSNFERTVDERLRAIEANNLAEKKNSLAVAQRIWNNTVTNGYKAPGTKTTIREWRLLINIPEQLSLTNMGHSGNLKKHDKHFDIYEDEQGNQFKVYRFLTGENHFTNVSQFSYEIVLSAQARRTP